MPVVHDLPGVGANLNDHYVDPRLAPGAGRRDDQPARPRRPGGARGVKFFSVGNGALTFGVTSAMVFCRSREGLAGPDLQLLFTPASYAQGVFRQLEREPGMTVAVCPVRPDSRGTIMAQSPDPFTYPAIRPNYLSAPSDLRVLIAGVNHTRTHLRPAGDGALQGRGDRSGAGGRDRPHFARFAKKAGTNVFHPVGTCKMGTDPMAVVDPRLRVSASTGCASSTPR